MSDGEISLKDLSFPATPAGEPSGSVSLKDLSFPAEAKPAKPAPSMLGEAAGALSRGFAPVAAGAALGAAAGAPLAGVGAIPGAAAGAGAVALTDLASAVYNPLAERLGWPKMATPQEMTDRVLDYFGVKKPTGPGGRILEAAAGGLAGTAGMVSGAAKLAEEGATPLVRGVARELAARPAAQRIGGALSGAAAQTAAEAGAGPVGQAAASMLGGIGIPRRGPIETPAGTITGKAAKAIRQVAKSLSESATGLEKSPAEIMQKMEEQRLAGKPTSLVDVGGKSVETLGAHAFRAPGPAGEMISRYAEDKLRGAGIRISDDINRHLLGDITGPQPSADQINRALSAEQKVQSEPLYQAAFAHQDVHSPAIEQMLKNPDVQRGIREGITILRREADAAGTPFDPMEYSITGTGPEGEPIVSAHPNMRLLDAAKIGLDEMLNKHRNPITGKLDPSREVRSLSALRESWVNELDSLNPDYAAARAAWAGPAKSKDAASAGEKILSPKWSAEDVAHYFDSLPMGARQFYKLGAASALRDQLRKKGIESPTVKGLADTALGTELQSKFRPLFSSEAEYDGFIHAVSAERGIYEKEAKYLSSQQSLVQPTEDDYNKAAAAAFAVTAVGNVASGRFIHAIAETIRTMRNYGIRTNPELNKQIARLLFSPEVGATEHAAVLQEAEHPSRIRPVLKPLSVVGGLGAVEQKP